MRIVIIKDYHSPWEMISIKAGKRGRKSNLTFIMDEYFMKFDNKLSQHKKSTSFYSLDVKYTSESIYDSDLYSALQGE